jgi:UDP-N-acetyl-D-mannosaminuronate dehydrogenase
VQSLLNDQGKAVKGSRVLVVGVTYKPDVADLRESPALDVVAGLRRLGAEVSYADPYVDDLHEGGVRVPRVVDPVAGAAGSDCVVLLSPHRDVDHEAVAARAPLMVDTRHAVVGNYPGLHGL